MKKATQFIERPEAKIFPSHPSATTNQDTAIHRQFRGCSKMGTATISATTVIGLQEIFRPDSFSHNQ